MSDDAANQNARVQAHVSRAAHGITEEIEHRDAHRAAKRDVRVSECVRQHFVPAAHPSENEGSSQQHQGGEDHTKCERQQ
jgi:hypothetical protein